MCFREPAPVERGRWFGGDRTLTGDLPRGSLIVVAGRETDMGLLTMPLWGHQSSGYQSVNLPCPITPYSKPCPGSHGSQEKAPGPPPGI